MLGEIWGGGFSNINSAFDSALSLQYQQYQQPQQIYATNCTSPTVCLPPHWNLDEKKRETPLSFYNELREEIDSWLKVA